MSFENKTIIVTGGAKGIGEGCVRVFHREGGQVVIWDTDESAGVELCRMLGERSLFIKCDVSKAVDVEVALQKTLQKFDGVDVLVNNAGIMPYFNVTETPEESWDRVMAVNVKGAFLCAKHILPVMMKKDSGVIVNMSSVQAFLAQEKVAAYVTSKSALIGLTRSIAVDYAPNIRCVAICPGGVDTPLNREAFRMSPDPEQVRQETVDIHLVKRIAQPEEIGELVAFVSSEKGSFITGQALRIDGGIGARVAGSKKD